MHKPSFLLVPPLPGVFVRRSAAYWVLLHMLRAIIVLWAAALNEMPVEPRELLPGGNPLVPAMVAGLGMLQARRSDEDLYLANLGYGWSTIAAYLLVPAAALEAVCTIGWLVWPGADAHVTLLAGLRAVFAA